MNIEEYNLVKNYNYLKYCDYLKNKYGVPVQTILQKAGIKHVAYPERKTAWFCTMFLRTMQ